MRKFLEKGFLAVLDQGLFSGTNFLVAVVLGRWLTPEDYGGFSVAMVVFLLASGQYGSFLLEPMSVFGPHEHTKSPLAYFRFVGLAHVILTAIISVIVLVITLFLARPISEIIRIMALCMPLTLTFWLTRWFFFMQTKPGISFALTLIYSLCLLGGLIIAEKSGLLSATIVFVIIGLASLIPSTLVLIFQMTKRSNDSEKIDRFRLFGKHWNYGKWIAAASLLNWVTLQLYMVLAASMINLTTVGSLRAIQNLAQPFEQISTALGLLLIPWASRSYLVDKEKFNQVIKSVSWALMAIGLVYLMVLWVFGTNFISLIYNGKYLEFDWLIPYVIGVPLIFAFSKGAQIGIRALRQPKYLLYSYSISALVSITMGPILISYFGLIGAVYGLILSSAAFSITTVVLFAKTNKKIIYEPKVST